MNYRHYFDGLNGVRCGCGGDSTINILVGLNWDSVTCPDCRKLKKDWEPETKHIDTKGD